MVPIPPQPPVHAGEILSTQAHYRITDLCFVCGIREELATALLLAGAIGPLSDALDTHRFSDLDMLRLQKALRLHHDLGIDLSAIALVLDLLDQTEDLRRQLRGVHAHD